MTTTFPVAVFTKARHTHPSLHLATLQDLADELTPELPVVRHDLVVQRDRDAHQIARLRQGAAFRSYGWERRAALRVEGGEDRTEVLDACERMRVKAFKLNASAWSPANYAEGATRKNANVLSLSCLVFDLDAGDPLDRCWELFSGHARLLHTSWSHSPKQPRCRLVVPLAAPVPAERWRLVWPWAAKQARESGLLGVDRSTKDRSRSYLLPAVPSTEALEHYECRRELEAPLLEVPADLPDVDAARRAERAYRLRRQREMARHYDGPSPNWWRDPVEREAAAARLGMSVRDNKAKGAPCPSCGLSAVWFFIDPDRMYRARCDHRKSCGWEGTLEELGGAP